ncbi:MAG: VIT1/CCC1 transporter family protein [Thermoplasmata archaeon]
MGRIGGRVDNFRKLVRQAAEMHDTMPIIRRYFVIGTFDGALTILGIILGAYAVGKLSNDLVLVAGMAAGIGLAISSAVGAFEAERIEIALRHKEIERAMLTRVKGDREETQFISNLASAVVHGVSPLVGIFIPLVPFLFLPSLDAMYCAIILANAFLFAIGAYLGSILKEMILYTGLRFVIAGLVTAIVIFLFGGKA